MPDDLPGYDAWKTRLPPEPYCDDGDCTCTTARRDKWCPIHGKDPDEAYEEWRDRQWDEDDWEAEQAYWEEHADWDQYAELDKEDGDAAQSSLGAGTGEGDDDPATLPSTPHDGRGA